MAKIDNVQKVAVADLVPYERNAKQHSQEQVERIAKSIMEFGFLNPVLIDNEKNVIAGHGRIMAAKLLGMEEVPCISVEGLTEEQRRAYVLADNKLTELGDWDMGLVYEELEFLNEMDFDVSITGFDFENINEDDYTDEFSLRDGDREPVQNMTITLSDDEAEVVNEAIRVMKQSQKFKDYDNPFNKNGNGNALFLVVDEWLRQRT